MGEKRKKTGTERYASRTCLLNCPALIMNTDSGIGLVGDANFFRFTHETIDDG
jgi:hypothetical protein